MALSPPKKEGARKSTTPRGKTSAGGKASVPAVPAVPEKKARRTAPAVDRKIETPATTAAPAAAPVQRQRRLSANERSRLIAEAAYLKAERRGFRGGSPEQDWYDAEAQVDAMLLRYETSGE